MEPALGGCPAGIWRPSDLLAAFRQVGFEPSLSKVPARRCPVWRPGRPTGQSGLPNQ